MTRFKASLTSLMALLLIGVLSPGGEKTRAQAPVPVDPPPGGGLLDILDFEAKLLKGPLAGEQIEGVLQLGFAGPRGALAGDFLGLVGGVFQTASVEGRAHGGAAGQPVHLDLLFD